jgi:hypothetical protein
MTFRRIRALDPRHDSHLRYPAPAGFVPNPPVVVTRWRRLLARLGLRRLPTDTTLVFLQPDWMSPDGTTHGRMFELWAPTGEDETA